LEVELNGNEISHRLPLNQNSIIESIESEHPPIRLRFSNRDERNELFSKQQRSNSSSTSKIIPKNFSLEEKILLPSKKVYSTKLKILKLLLVLNFYGLHKVKFL